MNIKEIVKSSGNGCILSIVVNPGSKKRELSYNEWRKSIEVSVKSPPKGGKANREVEEFLKEVLGAKVEIIKGHKSNQKQVFVELGKDELINKLERILK